MIQSQPKSHFQASKQRSLNYSVLSLFCSGIRRQRTFSSVALIFLVVSLDSGSCHTANEGVHVNNACTTIEGGENCVFPFFKDGTLFFGEKWIMQSEIADVIKQRYEVLTV